MTAYLFHIFKAFFLINFLCINFCDQFYNLYYFFLAPLLIMRLMIFFYQNKKDVYHISMLTYYLPFHIKLFRQKIRHI